MKLGKNPSFSTLIDELLKKMTAPLPRLTPPHGTRPVYVVARGRIPGVYSTWDDAEKQVRGFPRARFKKFQTWSGSGGDALKFWNDFASSLQAQTQTQAQPAVGAPCDPSGGSFGPSLASRKRHASDIGGDLASGRPAKEIRLSSAEPSSSPAIVAGPSASVLAARSITASQPAQPAQQQESSSSSNTDRLEVYTDGSCLSNPGGAGGWAAVFVVSRASRQDRQQSRDEVVTVSGSYPQTTNNRMELRAMTSALQMLPTEREATVFTDSQYVRRGVEEWVAKWCKNGWKTAKGTDVLNRDLWEELSATRAAHPRVALRWVKAHDGNRYNEIADKSARAAAREIQQSTEMIADW